jgi:hypothetical protein
MSEGIYPTFNGIEASWADFETSWDLNGQKVVIPIDYSAFSFEQTLEIGQTTSRGLPRKRTSGQLANTASATFYVSGIDALIGELAALAVQAGLVRGNVAQIGLLATNIFVQYRLPGSADLHERDVKGVRLTKLAEAATEGIDPQACEIDLSVADITYKVNGQEIALR